MISGALMIAGLAGVAATVVLSMLLAEVPAIASWLAPKVVRRAARRLPERLRAAKEEEWLAELQVMEGIKFFRVIFALGCFGAAIRIRRAEPSATSSHHADQAFAELKVVLDGVAYTLNGNVSRDELWKSLGAAAGVAGSARDIFELEARGERRWFVTVPRAEIGTAKPESPDS